MEERVTHTFAPVYDENSKVLILGTFPSIKSREMEFYYGHPQNRFWKVISALTEEETPEREEVRKKKEMLLKHGIAIWDVIASCKIQGSSDSSIRDVVPNEIAALLNRTGIEKVFANGAKAEQLYKKYVYPETNRPIVKLPSTSPANAAWSLERVCESWKAILNFD